MKGVYISAIYNNIEATNLLKCVAQIDQTMQDASVFSVVFDSKAGPGEGNGIHSRI